MAALKADKTVLDVKPLSDAVNKEIDSIMFKGVPKDDVAYDYLKKVKAEIDDWQWKDPAEFHTPEGLDALKQRIGAIYEKIDKQKEGNSSRVVGSVLNSAKNEIVKQAPEYAKTMKSYSEMADTIKELESALSLKDWNSVDTTMRKLQSLTRDNVNTNYGNRLQLAKELEKRGADIVPAVAGQAMSSWTPRGLQGANLPTQAGLAGYAGGPAGVAATLGASSPKIVGATTYGAGLVAGAPERMASYLRGMLPSSVESKLPVMTPARRKAVVNYLNQMSANNPEAQQ